MSRWNDGTIPGWNNGAYPGHKGSGGVKGIARMLKKMKHQEAVKRRKRHGDESLRSEELDKSTGHRTVGGASNPGDE